jgi:hypothetical protein
MKKIVIVDDVRPTLSTDEGTPNLPVVTYEAPAVVLPRVREAKTQLRWALGACGIAVIVIALCATSVGLLPSAGTHQRVAMDEPSKAGEAVGLDIRSSSGGVGAEIVNSGPGVGADISVSGNGASSVTGVRVIQQGPGTGMRVIQQGPGVGMSVRVGN